MKTYLAFQIFILFFLQIGYSINPMKEYKMKPDRFDIPFEEKKIVTTDGASLNTWIMKSKVEHKKDFTFIIAGSDAGNMGFSLPYAAYLLNNGYDVVTFDYRGFGESSDFDFNPNNLYHDEYVVDFTTVVHWIKENLSENKIGILAFSMGTLVATHGYKKTKYDLLVGEAFIKSPKKTTKRIQKIKRKKIKLPKSARTHRRKINKIDIPILLFASTSDKITTLRDSQKIVSKKSNRKLIEFEGEHLRGAFTLGMDNYINAINEIF